MTSAHDPVRALRTIRSIDDVLTYLREELDWPADSADLDMATFEYNLDELGVPPERMPNLISLRRLRPLTTGQPWGVFFIEFQGPRLPVTPLRRLLQAVVTKKRAGRSGDRATWMLDDLLFIVVTEAGATVELHFLAFFDTGGNAPEIRSLPWRPADSPPQHLRRLAEEILPLLRWPDDPDDVSTWKQGWRRAFTLRHGEPINSAARLAERMATTAQALRTQLLDGIASEDLSGPLHRLMDEVRRELVADVDEPRFADMCAQTLVYGVLTSRVTDPIGFGASPTLATFPLSNPFLAAFFEQVHDQAVDLDLEGSGLQQLTADLRRTNVEAILDQFGATNKGGDPVIHFYEEFLQRYDRRLRADAGAFYTPQPVVAFMVRAVDDILRHRFGLAEGIADTTPWRTVAEHLGIEVPAGVDPDGPFLSVLDPATGTGTFLVEWLRKAKESSKARTDLAWRQQLASQLLPTLHAFEVMLGPYAIAHLKVALELQNQGAADGALEILLTDTLDFSGHDLKLDTMGDPVAIEGEIANQLKTSERFTVIIGNPPYDREQGTTATSRRKGGVVRYGTSSTRPLLDDVIQPMRDAGLGVHIKNLYNDYIYFWRWAVWQATERTVGPGVVAFITASSYLDGVSIGGLRHLLREAFDELWIIDLGGDSRGAHPEENVFDIRTPVAIAIGVRTSTRPNNNCTVRYKRIAGTRAEKFATLEALSLLEVTTTIPGQGLQRLVPRGASDYGSWPQITDFFPWIHSGCQVKRTWPIGPSKSLLERRWRDLVRADPTQRDTLLKETRDRTVRSTPAALLPASAAANGRRLAPLQGLDAVSSPEGIERYGYRSFDRQWLIADNRVADFPRPELWRVRGPKQLYLTTLTSTKLGRGPAVTVSPYVPDLDHFRGSYGAKNVIPLYNDSRAQRANAAPGLLDVLGEHYGTSVAVEEFAAYVHALCGTAAFSDRFRAELLEAAEPFRLPVTADAELFDRAVTLGTDLLWWHTWGERFGSGPLPTSPTKVVRPVSGYPERFSFDAATGRLTVGSGVFAPVTSAVWEFEVSGLKPLQSWLGYRMAERRGRRSSPLDDIRPTKWTFTDELLTVMSILYHTCEVTAEARALLDEIVDGPLLPPDTLLSRHPR